ncbi:hypothetical protein [Aliivibrio finisterrensis]|uniref:Uncharacterized protein n=1 Tax=Aliivibrio finisterrensis TaxID=511998 RepID=A0ABY0I9N7_9GAMM|nr:hypothetical protein [Aliivibrio finisterrensis]RYU64350.1 hypothetical protein ERW53_10455 [Aliivibrio finisterrensis]RYU83962.1 hypothetical protein ERW52_12295 [Aliivibrio finisterrensis]
MSALTITLNREQKLYVMRHQNKSFSCLGFDVVANRIDEMHEFFTTKQNMVLPAKPIRKGTMKAYNFYNLLVDLARGLYKEKGIKTPTELSAQLNGLEGKQVEVVDCYGETRRFYVGRSTGFIPCHLEISHHNSSGGGAVTGTPFKRVTVISAK